MTTAQPVARLDVREAARRLDDTSAEPVPLLVDVREVDEHRVMRVPGSTLLPMSEIPQRFAELPSDRPLLLLCAAGRRSMAVAEFLARNGYRDLANVEGGIAAWAEQVDPSVPKY